MQKWYMIVILIQLITFPLSCSFSRQNPLDEGGSNYIPPKILFSQDTSSLKNGDTIHFDSMTIALVGNREESRFNLKMDNDKWGEIWEPARIFGFGRLADGKHTLYINSMYSGWERIVSDSITFYVVTKGYKPEFSISRDTTITLFEGMTTALSVKAEGYTPIHYDWTKGTSVLEGKNSDTLKITSFSVNDSGSYKCIVTNTYGRDTSRTFILNYRSFTGGIKGIVSDSLGKYLKDVTVTLSPLNKKDTTDSTGSFAFTSLSKNSCSLQISLSKYQDTTLLNVMVNDSETLVLPTIKLKLLDTTTYRIAYNGNGNDSGNVPSDTTKYKPGKKIAVAGIGNLSKIGYAFSKWNTKKDGSGDAFSPGDSIPVNGNITFYAQWVVKQYILSFNGNGSTSGNTPEQAKYDYQKSITIPAKGTLDRAGYSFTGWNTKINGTGKAYSANDTLLMPASNVELFSQWNALPTYKITYNKNYADTGTVPIDTNNYYKGKEVTVDGNPGKLYRNGYSFSGWNTKVDVTGETFNAGAKFAMPDSAVTLYAKWTTNPTYSLIYHSTTNTGGDVPATVNADSGMQVIIADSGSLYKNGYTFVGWNIKEDGSGKAYKTGDKIVMGTVNIDLYAQWTKAQYTIMYYGNGHTGGTVPPKTTHLYQTEITIAGSGDLEKTGYSFVMWNADPAGNGLDYQSGNKISVDKNINLYARWVKKKFKITFSGNGDKTNNVPAVTEYEYGSPIDSATVVPLRLGYFFAGWFKDSVGTGKWNYSHDSVVVNDTLYAKWIIKDVDGNTYHEVKIGNQVWMLENLKTTKYNDGTPIPFVTDSLVWSTNTTPAYCWNNNVADYKETYGGLYNWYVVDPNNPHKVAPEGWHIPDLAEYSTLVEKLGGWSIAGGKLKDIGTKYWIAPNEGATNESGFSALPNGFRDNYGSFRYIGEKALWWITTVTDSTYVMDCGIFHASSSTTTDPFVNRVYGLGLRCIRDW